jgi:hypothetical protein
MNRRARLNLTHLEDRLVPAGFGNTWVDTNLTVSFAPDGTDVAGVQSRLFQTLNSRMKTTDWQREIRDAFQQWVVPVNLNVWFVADDGRAFGTPEPIQGSPYVGDIRIAARPLSDNVLAISNPFDLVSPWAGEIVINSNKIFDKSGRSDRYDLRTVVLQEIGHVLGVGNSTDPNSVMYEAYQGTRKDLSSGDLSAITALYGARSSDRYEVFRGNDTIANATSLRYVSSLSQLTGIDPFADATRFIAEGDIRNATDIDYYKVTVPKETFVVLVQTGGLSQAELLITIHDSTGKELAKTARYNTNTGQYRISYSPSTEGDYYISVRTASGQATDVGSYRLVIGKSLSTVPTSDLSTRIQTPYFGFDMKADWGNAGPANDSFDKAQWLGIDLGNKNSRWDYTGSAGIDVAQDVDVFSVTTTSSPQNTLVVAVWSETQGRAPLVEVYDKNKQRITGVELLRNGSTTIFQIEGLNAWSTYYVVFKPASPGTWKSRESYRFGIDFRNEPITLDSLANTTLTSQQPQLMREMEVTRSQMFRFQLSATGTGNTGARLSIFDETGNAVFTLASTTGNTVIGDVLLAPGKYKVVIVGGTADGTPLQPLQVFAFYLPLTDPIGPALADDYYSAPATTTSASSTPTDSGYKTASTTSTNDGYYWLTTPTLGDNFLSLTDPYSLVWW